MTHDLIVIGAGAAGMMAASKAAESGLSVLMLEKMKMAGRKLRITGKGRCNLTNDIGLSEFLSHIAPDSRFLRPSFSQFFTQDLVKFFTDLDVPTVVERGGRVFPESESAVQVAEALVKSCLKNKVQILYEQQVNSISCENNLFSIKSSGGEFAAKNVLISTGGASYPATGSTGDGYKFAKTFGHTITAIRPALVPFETSGEIAQKLQGLSLKNVQVNVWVDGKKNGSEFGEMLFTHFGLSGPIILTLSRQYVDFVQQKRKVVFSIDLKPALDEKTLDARLLRDLNEHGKMKFQNLLKNLLPQKLIPVCSQLTGISLDKECHQISAQERKILRVWLKDFRFEIFGHRSFKEAIITAGGVSLKEINPNTLESKIVPGLYFAGEVLDLDADTGGYNLQIAFSTAWMAANSIAKKLIN